MIRRFVFLLILMTLFNFMSHGTQDQHPTFLKEQHHASADLAVLVAVIYNIGALCGGVTIGALSESIGRRKAVLLTTLLALPVVPVLILTALVTWLGPENRGAQLGEISAPERRRPAAAPVANPASPRSP